ncbi:MAG: hypothetical protein R3174_07660 [Gammaproteobacteria bacterium]|nr:hypothetical protein [Gammaproteobacteria bacterium]
MAAVGTGDHELAQEFVARILELDPKNSTAVALNQALDAASHIQNSLSEAKGEILNPKPVQ